MNGKGEGEATNGQREMEIDGREGGPIDKILDTPLDQICV